MFDQVRQFTTMFRELENQERSVSREDQVRGQRLRQVLSTSLEAGQSSYQLHRYVLVIASFYPQAGASFIASNLAYYQAGKRIPVVLCEAPSGQPYYYFALDGEVRAESSSRLDNHTEKIITMHDGYLRVKANAPYDQKLNAFPEVTNWLMGNSKEASLLIIDISSFWRSETSSWIMDMADEIWFVFDTDVPRFARTILMEEAPKAWNDRGKKVRLIANRWDQAFAKEHLMKKMEGTLSYWNHNQIIKQIDFLVPAISSEKIMKAHEKAKFFLEMYPEEEDIFAQMSSPLEA